MDLRVLTLYYFCSLAGVVMVVGGIWLVYKQKIYIDRESKQVTEIETPIGKFKTNIPALALFMLGFVPLIFPIIKISEQPENLIIRGHVKSDVLPVGIYAVVEDRTLNFSGDYRLDVPNFANAPKPYRLILVANQMLLDDVSITPKGGKREYEVRESDISLAHGEAAPVYETAQIDSVPSDF